MPARSSLGRLEGRQASRPALVAFSHFCNQRTATARSSGARIASLCRPMLRSRSCRLRLTSSPPRVLLFPDLDKPPLAGSVNETEWILDAELQHALGKLDLISSREQAPAVPAQCERDAIVRPERGQPVHAACRVYTSGAIPDECSG